LPAGGGAARRIEVIGSSPVGSITAVQGLRPRAAAVRARRRRGRRM